MRIAVAQLNTHAGDFDTTVGRMLELSATAAANGADLLVFSLCALTGPLPPEYASQEGYLIDLSEALVRISDEAACPCLVPVVTEMEGSPFAEAMLLRDGEVTPLRMLSYFSQAHGGQSLGPDPHRTSHDGTRSSNEDVAPATTFEMGGLRFALAFTYDDIEDLYSRSGSVDAVLFLSGYGFALDDAGSALGASLAENRFASDALALDAWLVAVGSLGGYGMQVFCGSSFVMDHEGGLVASAPAFEESILYANLEARNNESSGRSGVIPLGILDPSRYLEPELYNRSLHLWEALVLGLHDYLSKLDLSEVALVLDGSIGSCVLAALATDAVGPTHVHVLLAPERLGGQAMRAGEVATRLAESLRVVVERCELDLAGVAADDEALLCDVCQACLASVARSCGALPLSAEDKTFLALEAGTCQCRAAALLPLGDVYRSDVMELAHMRNTVSPVIPAEAFSLFSVPEVEGLDEAEASRELRLKRVDVTLMTHVEWERTLGSTVARQGAREVTERILARVDEVGMARIAWPPYLMMSSRTLFDARMPLGFAWHDHVRDQEEQLKGGEAMSRIAAAAEASQDGEREVPPDVAAFLEELGSELSSGELPEGVDRREVEHSLGELFGLLQDLAQSGGLTLERPDGKGQGSFGGPMGPLTWGGPFSEN